MNETQKAEKILTNGQPYGAVRDYVGVDYEWFEVRSKLIDFAIFDLKYFTDETIDVDEVDWDELVPFFISE